MAMRKIISDISYKSLSIKNQNIKIALEKE